MIGDLRDKFAITTDAERAQNYAMAEQKLTTEGLADSLSGLSGEQRNAQIAYLEGVELIKDMTKEEIKAQAKQKLGIKLTKERQPVSYTHLLMRRYRNSVRWNGICGRLGSR